jgi:hypothetical protein
MEPAADGGKEAVIAAGGQQGDAERRDARSIISGTILTSLSRINAAFNNLI